MTKNTLKFLGLCLTLAAAAVLAPRSYAANSAEVQSQWYGQLSLGETKIGGTTPTVAVATTTTLMDLYYNGTATASYVNFNASSMTFFAPFNVADTSIGTQTSIYTAGTFDLAASTMNTLGQLCDAINAVAAYHCTLTGGIRSDLTTYLPASVVAVSGTNNLNSVGGYLVPVGTSTIQSLGIIPAQGRRVILNYCSVNGAGVAPLQVFGVRAKYGIGAWGLDAFGNVLTDSALAWQSPAITAATTTNEPLSTLIPLPWLEFGAGGVSYTYKAPPVGNAYNGHVVVRLNNFGNGSAAGSSTQFISCQWMEK